MEHEKAIFSQLEFTASILDCMEELVSITDLTGRYVMVNQTFCNFHQISSASLMGKTDYDFRPQAVANEYCQYDSQVLQQGESFLFEFQELAGANGHITYFEVNKKPIYNSLEQVVGILTVSRDMTARKELHHRLKLSEEKYAKAFQLSPDAIILSRLRDGLYLEVSQGFTKVMGYTEAELLGKTSLNQKVWVNQGDRLRLLKGLRKTGEVLDLEAKFRTKSGKIITALVSAKIIDIEAEPCIISYCRNITERKETEEYLTFLNEHDALTGLYNRNYLGNYIDKLLAKGISRIGLIIFDIDGLKMINDTLGPVQGDERLLFVKRLLLSVLKNQGILARVGGDEFAVLIPNGTIQQLEQLVDEVTQKIRTKRVPTSSIMPLTLSAGYAVGDLLTADFQALFKEADDNMYRQKLLHSQSNRNTLVKTVVELLKVRDFVTEEHADRLQDITCSLARSYGYAEHKLSDLRILAQFHDIGKIGIPDSILNKPSRLTAEEMAEMKRHSQIGYGIAQAIPEIAVISDWILKHHEWWDGSGYPLGLQGHEIPLECRMLAICDAYDAMTSDRPYRKALKSKQALVELDRFKGIQFDPAMVDLFIQNIAGEEIR